MIDHRENITYKRTQALCDVHRKMSLWIDRYGVNRTNLNTIKHELIRFVQQHSDLFPVEHFPIADQDDYTIQLLIRNSQAKTNYLYLSSHTPERAVLPHDHQTFAVTVGLSGVEENVFYRKGEEGEPFLVETERTNVELGSGIVCLPDDIHSIRVVGSEPTRTFRFYGKKLQDQNKTRTFFDIDNKTKLRMLPDDTFEPIY